MSGSAISVSASSKSRTGVAAMGSGFAVMTFRSGHAGAATFSVENDSATVAGRAEAVGSSVRQSIPRIELNSETRLVHLSRRAGPCRGLDIRRIFDVHRLQTFRCEPFPDFQANFFGQIDELDASFFLRAAGPGNFPFCFEPIRGSGKLKAKVYERLGWQDAYRVNSDAGFADVENDSTVVCANIQVGEGFDFLTAQMRLSRPLSELSVCVDIGDMVKMPCGWGFRNLNI